MIIIPNLGLDDLKNADLVVFAQQRSNNINLVGALGAVNPSTGTVDTKRTEYSNALPGTNTQLKKDLRGELEELLTLQALDVSRIAAGNLNLYLQSGYKAKDVQGDPVGELEAPDLIVFREYGKNPGELHPDWPGVVGARNYTYQVFTDVDDPEGSKIREETVNDSQAVITGLTRGLKTWTRVRSNGGANNHSSYGDPAEKIVP